MKIKNYIRIIVLKYRVFINVILFLFNLLGFDLILLYIGIYKIVNILFRFVWVGFKIIGYFLK